MIHQKNRLLNILAELENHDKFEFYLTGSQHFETPNNTSDFDFYVEETNPTNKLQNYLETIGFNLEANSVYDGDDLLKQIWVWRSFPFIPEIAQQQIHIQVVENAKIKTAAQTVIKRNIHLRILLREKGMVARSIWNSIYEAIYHGMDYS